MYLITQGTPFGIDDSEVYNQGQFDGDTYERIAFVFILGKEKYHSKQRRDKM